MRPDSENYRPKPFYFLTDVGEEALSVTAAQKAMAQLAGSGFGGCVLFNKPPTGFSAEEFLGPAWFRCVRRFAEAARDRGMAIWINDGFDFPPGDAAGRIAAAAPELSQRYLVLDDQGEVAERTAEWGFPAFEDPHSAELFAELVYEPHRRELGDLFGHGITGFFSDADCRRVCHGRFDAMGKRHYFPWSRQFSRRFAERFGYAIEPRLKGVMTGMDPEAAHHYWLLAGELYQSWFAANYRWCLAHGLEYTFHTSDLGPLPWDDYPRSSAFTEGDYFFQARFATWPGTDHELGYLDSCFGARREALTVPQTFWGARMADLRGGEQYRRVRGDTRAKLAGSAAYLYRRPGAMCEMFAATNWSCTPAMVRDIAAWQIMQGINFVVPHAWHHRLGGDTKFFAPPDFSPHNNWSAAMRGINDRLAAWCAVASAGELVAPVALLYPVRRLWENRGDANRYFVAAEALNRLPHGYVVVSPEQWREHDRKFEYVVNAGVDLSLEQYANIARSGARILEVEELNLLPPVTDCRWEGSGRPHFMRRCCDEGAILLLGNIEDDVPITGTLHWQGREFAVTLEPGEIAWWTPWEECFRSPERVAAEIALPETAKVSWDAPNRIPLCRWTTPDGKAVGADAAETALEFRWRNAEAIPDPEWWLPEAPAMGTFACDGVALQAFGTGTVFDDAYRIYRLAGAGAAGEHVLRWTKQDAAPQSAFALQYLSGEFDAAIGVAGPPVASRWQYLYELQIPMYAEVTLSRRRSELHTGRSWAEQGQPFYSGGATYECEFAVPEDNEAWELFLPRVECVAEAEWNGVELGLRFWSPYRWTLPSGGAGRLRLRVRNTLANQLEAYRADSGLTGGWKLRRYAAIAD